jgi:hypothetical protein
MTGGLVGQLQNIPLNSKRADLNMISDQPTTSQTGFDLQLSRRLEELERINLACPGKMRQRNALRRAAVAVRPGTQANGPMLYL